MVKRDKPKTILSTGKRRLAVARARIVPGTGKVFINSTPLEVWGNEPLRLWVKEPLILSNDLAKKVDIRVTAKGGGIVGQAEAVRMAIARCLVDFSKSEELRNKFMEYDRNLLVYDPRRNEPHKPSRSKTGPRRHKQRSKR
jgi:small subunit ribosomal protein S9